MPVDIEKLQEGDIVRHANGNVYTVIRGATPTREAVAVRSISIQNAGEWAGVVRAAMAPEPPPVQTAESPGLLPEHQAMLDEAYRNPPVVFDDYSDASLRLMALRCVKDYHCAKTSEDALGNAVYLIEQAYQLGREIQRAEDEKAAAAYFEKMAKEALSAAKRKR